MALRSVVQRAALLAVLAIALLIALQPLGVFWHFVEDHLDGHSHGSHGGVAIHEADTDGGHHEADHGHVWMPPAASVVVPRVDQPQSIAALGSFEDIPWPSAAPFPPFSPPRA